MAGDDSSETAALPPPKIGSYRLVEPLGSGGMSSVFRAEHVETGHEVAVKVLPRYLAKNSTLLQRFLREAKSAESLEDPNIVAIYDRGSEAGRYYLVLEYVPGGDLHDRVREHGPLPILEAVDAIRQVARGLKHAASRGLIHRDIKPANILRTPQGLVKVTDLGLALHTADEDERVTRDGTTVGTVDYMAPEQARDSRGTSIRSDIYSLGCTFYYLLTGSPPFQGGDVSEKLRAHATEPPPDARQVRKDTPEIIARLIRRMMAKKPEKRFPDYDVLLEVLDAVAATLSTHKPSPSSHALPVAEPLYALIDDEDDAPADAPLMALIDDDEDHDEEVGFTLGGPGPARSASSTISSSPAPGDLDLSALSGLVEGPAAETVRRGPPVPSTSGSRPTITDPTAPPPDELYDLEPPIQSTPHLYELAPPAEPLDIVGWLTKITLAAVVLMIAWFAWDRFGPSVLSPLEENGGVASPEPDKNLEITSEVKPEPPWVEPIDEEKPLAVEEAPWPEAEVNAIGLSDAATEVPPRAEGPFPEVTRITKETLRDALDKVAGTVDIADNGPIVEDDLKVTGKLRLIRAAESYEPVILLQPPGQASVRDRPATIVLSGQKLVIEGVHFVIDGREVSPRQQSFFLLRNSQLTLRDCTFTILGPTRHAYAVVKMGETDAVPPIPPSSLRLERTLIRGAATAVMLAGASDVTIARSALISRDSPPIVIAGNATEPRSLNVFRSVLASGTSAIALSGSAGASGARPARFSAFQTTIASIDVGEDGPLIGLIDVPAGPPRTEPWLVWKGDANRFIGWSELEASMPGSVLSSLRTISPGSGSSSAEDPARWPVVAADPWLPKALPVTVAASLASPLDRVANPPASLHERTLGAFDPVVIAPAEPSGPVLNLNFNADDETWKGNLGRFLTESIPKTARRVHVKVTGEGPHATSAVALADGVSLKIEVPNQSGKTRPLMWTAADSVKAKALISVRNAALEMDGVRLASTPKSRIDVLLSVDHGQLKLSRCVLTGPGAIDTVGGGLVFFRTDGTRPYKTGTDPAISDVPTCLLTDCVLVTGGAAITAEVGRGVVALSNCAVAAGSRAFVLRPEKVRRDRFAADLVLDHCTIAADSDFVNLEDWPGLPPGPDRPWVVRTEKCAFLDAYARDRTPFHAVLLRTAAEGLTRNALTWISSGDVYDLTQFTVSGAAIPTASSRFDIVHDWLNLWGPDHVRSPRGPKSVRLLVDRLKPAEVKPGDLALDPTFHPGQPALDVGADFSRLNIPPTTPSFKPQPGS